MFHIISMLYFLFLKTTPKYHNFTKTSLITIKKIYSSIIFQFHHNFQWKLKFIWKNFLYFKQFSKFWQYKLQQAPISRPNVSNIAVVIEFHCFTCFLAVFFTYFVQFLCLKKTRQGHKLFLNATENNINYFKSNSEQRRKNNTNINICREFARYGKFKRVVKKINF